MKKDMTAEQILRAAAEHLRKFGWRQGAATWYGQPGCLITALCSVSDARSRVNACDVLASDVIGGRVDIATFNDHHCRTADDAIAALLIAADLAAPEWKP